MRILLDRLDNLQVRISTDISEAAIIYVTFTT